MAAKVIPIDSYKAARIACSYCGAVIILPASLAAMHSQTALWFCDPNCEREFQDKNLISDWNTVKIIN